MTSTKVWPGDSVSAANWSRVTWIDLICAFGGSCWPSKLSTRMSLSVKPVQPHERHGGARNHAAAGIDDGDRDLGVARRLRDGQRGKKREEGGDQHASSLWNRRENTERDVMDRGRR